MRMGAVVEARLGSEGVEAKSDSVLSSEKWSDSDIEMAIAFGF